MSQSFFKKWQVPHFGLPPPPRRQMRLWNNMNSLGSNRPKKVFIFSFAIRRFFFPHQILASSKWWSPNFCQISDFICLIVAILLPTKGILHIWYDLVPSFWDEFLRQRGNKTHLIHWRGILLGLGLGCAIGLWAFAPSRIGCLLKIWYL